MTLWCLRPQKMPGHSHKCRDSFQELRMPMLSLVISALKASKDSLSTSCPTKREEAEVRRKSCMKIDQTLITILGGNPI